ncbi:hypothetical protein LJC23_07270 [Desulfovibrio sp. OttesenSCG-928-I05]|nr:hypothetical protein [Desulfovibrio sp. OttesenSCG-928-I05]
MSDQKTERQYRTRYGITTAPDAAYDLLDRSWERLHFLKNVLEAVGQTDGNIAMESSASSGLSAILEDIAIDVQVAHFYYTGTDDMPGKTGEAPEVKS